MIVDILFDQKTTIVKEDRTSVTKGDFKNINATESDKKREVMDAIKFLKSKETKTKADREKIQMLEVILKSV